MPIFRDGEVNLAGLTNPGLYVGIVPPVPFVVGVPTNIEAVVGVGSWGPVNAVTAFSTPDDCAALYGPAMVRFADISSHVAAACQGGQAVNFRGVRVTDGTDVAASATVATNCITFTGRYTGSRGNQIKVSFQKSAKANSYAVIVNFPGRAPERFDNITGAGNALWVAMADAINKGTSQRRRSDYIVATAGNGTTAPTVGTAYSLTGGTDGASGVGTSHLVGVDTLPRTGMYALRGSGADSFALADLVDTTAWTAMLTFGISEQMLALMPTASGDSITNAVATRASVGIDDPLAWILVGDWPTFYDPANGSRLVSPAAIAQGLLGNLSPEQSPINKPLRQVSATQTSSTGVLTSDSENALAQNGGVDVIGRSAALGQTFFSFLTGRNASSNTAANGIEYTRLTAFLARSVQGAAARTIVGRLQSIRADDPTRIKAKAVLDSFFQQLKSPSSGSDGYGMIEDFGVTCDETNNTPTTIARGYLFAFCAVKYLNVVRYFVIKLMGGGNVSVTVQDTPPNLGSVIQAA